MKDKIHYILWCLLLIPIGVVAKNLVALTENKRAEILIESDRFQKTNTTFLIKTDLDLGGQELRVGEGSQIRLQGGVLRNGKLNLRRGASIVGEGKSGRLCSNFCLVAGGQNVTISQLNFQCDEGAAVLSYADCDNLSIMDCRIVTSKNNGVKLVMDNTKETASGISIRGCDFVFKRMGIELQNHRNDDYRFDDVEISDCTFQLYDNQPNYGYAVSLSGYGKNARVEQCIFSGTRVGVEVVGFRDVMITKNQFNDIIKNAIICSNTRKMYDVSIVNNQINSPEADVHLATTYRTKMSKNAMNIHQVLLRYSFDAVISDNDITSNYTHALQIEDGQGNTIKQNRIVMNGKAVSAFRCFGGQSMRNTFQKNKVTYRQGSGIMFDQTGGATGNKCK